MKHTLKAAKIGYSKSEIKVFELLGSKTKAKSTTELIKEFYGRNMPFNGRKIVIGLLRSLRRKITENRESFVLASSDRKGPHSMQFWLESK